VGDPPIRLSKLIFGTGNLSKLGTEKRIMRILDQAVDLGITHFDTSPLYGFGVSERLLGICGKRHPDITFTTKVGLYPPVHGNESASKIFLRKVVQRLLRSKPRINFDFSISQAEESLQRSLSRLGRSEIDILLLHNPPMFSANDSRLYEWIRNKKTQGYIRNFGVSCSLTENDFFRARLGDDCLIQNIFSNEINEVRLAGGKPPELIYGAVRASLEHSNKGNILSAFANALPLCPESAFIVGTSNSARLIELANSSRDNND
jgi:diketogulonate reductase-like aldo/keto reductase